MIEDQPIWRALSDAVTALAFQGIPNAPGEALRRLCVGDWRAQGSWEWTACGVATYQASENSLIPTKRFEALKEGLAKRLPGYDHDEIKWHLASGQSVRFCLPGQLPFLSSLGPKAPSEEMAEWAWRYDRFETALLTEAGQEEWFSAVSIEVCETPQTASPPAPLAVTTTNKGGRPPAADWEDAALVMAGRYYRGELKPATTADVLRALQDWAAASGLDLPDATARPHAKRIFDAFRAWEAA